MPYKAVIDPLGNADVATASYLTFGFGMAVVISLWATFAALVAAVPYFIVSEILNVIENGLTKGAAFLTKASLKATKEKITT